MDHLHADGRIFRSVAPLLLSSFHFEFHPESRRNCTLFLCKHFKLPITRDNLTCVWRESSWKILLVWLYGNCFEDGWVHVYSRSGSDIKIASRCSWINQPEIGKVFLFFSSCSCDVDNAGKLVDSIWYRFCGMCVTNLRPVSHYPNNNEVNCLKLR